MNTRTHLSAAATLTASAIYVGGWAAPFPRSFYDTFPGMRRVWVATDGPYSEHLVRDVGSLYLALAVAGVLALLWRDRRSLVMLGAAWSTFCVLHLSYHLGHHVSTSDRVAEVGSLGLTLVLALVLLVPVTAVRKESRR